MSVVYCQRWNKRLNKPIKPLAEEEARAAHHAGAPYCAASIDDATGRVDRVVELALRSGHATVYFFDSHARVAMTYTFGPHDALLFLRNITVYDYGEADEYRGMSQAERIEQDDFNPDGTGRHQVDDEKLDEHFAQDLSLKPGRAMDFLLEPVPGFGGYASIARSARSEPLTPFG